MINKYRSDIDGLRAVAVLPVIFFHLHLVGFQGGYVGVDMFFVISGYLITGLIYAGVALAKLNSDATAIKSPAALFDALVKERQAIRRRLANLRSY